MSLQVSLANQYCPCNWDIFTRERDWLFTLGKLVIAISGVAGAIFSGSWMSCIGFVLFGLTVLYDECFLNRRDIDDLTKQIQESDQTLRQKQEKIIGLTSKLEVLEKQSQATHIELQKDISQVTESNHSLQNTVESLQKNQKTLKQEKEELSALNRMFLEKLEASVKVSQTLERRTQTFIQHNQEFTPQMDRLSKTTSHLEGTWKTFDERRTTLEKMVEIQLQALTGGLVTWKQTAEGMQQQINKFQSTFAQDQATIAELTELTKKLHQEKTALENEITLLRTVSQDLTQLQKDFAKDTEALAEIMKNKGPVS